MSGMSVVSFWAVIQTELLGQAVPVELPAKDIRPLDIASLSRGTCY